MTEQELVKALMPAAAFYNLKFTKEQYALWFELFEWCPAKKFSMALKAHLMCPERGHFQPVPGSLMRFLVHSDTKIKAMAAEEFDSNPGIDGTDSHTLQHESFFDRNQRKRQYVTHDLEQWRDWSTPRKLAFSGAISRDDAQRIENSTQGIEHAG
ncbi:hypothetical protein [uncultured Paraglaciecola sp.]|uniref:hypothetical protein n=1 Tax=uncultured Paraglaciecola sp. TaxID=1765024 RepID=UPI00262A6684|nr:hypothetical protein [uncultured Paraglaciecola sp.]